MRGSQWWSRPSLAPLVDRRQPSIRWPPSLGCASHASSTFFALREPSPVTAWLRALAGDAHLEHGGPGVGVVGMCLTGGFGLAMMADPTVIAPVLCQPSLPLPMGRSRRSAIGLSDADWRLVRHRVRAGCQVVGLRFTGDRVSPPERFELLRDRLGDDFTSFEIDSSPGNEEGIPTASHSVLTESFVDQPGHPTLLATNYVIGFLRQKLLGRPPPQPPTAATIQLYADARRQVLELLARAARRSSVGSHVFISYAHDDAAYVGDLVVALEARGIRAWYDAHIPTGATWETVLHQHVDTSRAVIVVIEHTLGRFGMGGPRDSLGAGTQEADRSPPPQRANAPVPWADPVHGRHQRPAPPGRVLRRLGVDDG